MVVVIDLHYNSLILDDDADLALLTSMKSTSPHLGVVPAPGVLKKEGISTVKDVLLVLTRYNVLHCEEGELGLFP